MDWENEYYTHTMAQKCAMQIAMHNRLRVNNSGLTKKEEDRQTDG
jgi:hypothetical protein